MSFFKPINEPISATGEFNRVLGIVACGLRIGFAVALLFIEDKARSVQAARCHLYGNRLECFWTEHGGCGANGNGDAQVEGASRTFPVDGDIAIGCGLEGTHEGEAVGQLRLYGEMAVGGL